MAVHKSISQMSRLLAAVIGLALVGYIAYLVGAQYRSQLALQETALKQFTSDSRQRATALSYFFSAQKDDLQELAESRELAAYFENQALGMSMEYGLRASLFIVDELFSKMRQSKVFMGQPIFERIVFVDASGAVLADTNGPASPEAAPQLRQYLRPDANGSSLSMVQGAGELKFLISSPVIFKGHYEGQVLAWLSSSQIYRGFVGGDGGTQRYPTALVFNGNYVSIPAKVKEIIGARPVRIPRDIAPLTPYRMNPAGGGEGGGYGMLVPVEGTQLSLMAFVPGAEMIDLHSPRRMLYTTGAIAVFILFGLFYLQVINTRNVVLEVHLEEQTLREAAVEEKNRLLAAEIEERRQAELAFREGEARFRALVDAVPVTIYEFRQTPTGRSFTFVSEKILELAGITPETMVADADAFFQLIHPEEREAALAASEHAVASGSRFGIEFRIIKPDGETRWILASSLPGGDCGTRYGCLEDITDRKEADLSLRESRQQLLDIISFLPDATLVVDREGRVVAWNKAMEVMTGVRADEMIGKGEFEYALPFYGERRPILIDLALHPQLETPSYRGLSNEEGLIYGESCTPNLGSQDIYLAGAASVLRNSKGEVTAAIECIRDISERMLAEQQLRESEATLRSLMDAMPAGVWWYDDDGRIEYLNSRFAELFGYGREEIPSVNHWLANAYPDAEQRAALVEGRKELIARARRDGMPASPLEIMVTCRDGSERHIIVNTQFFQGRTLEIFTDITEQEFIHNELLKVQKMESLGVLAGGIAHDFNNILTGVIGFISLAQMLLEESHAAHPMLVSAEKAALRASELAYQLLTFARGGEPNKKVVSVPRLVEEAISLSLRGTNVQGKMVWADGLYEVEADAGQMNQAFNNLVINAVHAMPEGGTLTVRGDNVQLEKGNNFSLEPGRYVRLLFEDEGCGIAPEVLKKIFDPYFTTKTGGNGLGLASTLSIIRKHGGHIQVHSQVGVGTTFTFYLPAAAASPARHESSRNAADSLLAPHAGGTILLMDDEEMILELCSQILAHLGYKVATSVDGAQAIEMYKAAKEAGTPYQAVIMDLTIPGGMGGREAAQRLLAYDPAAKLIVSSGYSHELSLSNASNYGFLGAVKKPYQVSDLAEALELLQA